MPLVSADHGEQRALGGRVLLGEFGRRATTIKHLLGLAVAFLGFDQVLGRASGRWTHVVVCVKVAVTSGSDGNVGTGSTACGGGQTPNLVLGSGEALVLAVEILGFYDLLLELKVMKFAVLALVTALATKGATARGSSMTSTWKRTFVTWGGETEQAHGLRGCDSRLLERAEAGV